MNARLRPPRPTRLAAALSALIASQGLQAQTAPAAPEPAPAASAAPAREPVTLVPVLVPGKRPTEIGPMPGLTVTKDQIPANVQSATSAQIRESRSLNLGDYMNSQLQGVSVNDYAGNPFQLDVNYRGFTAGSQVGTPQGLSVFFDGVRVNEPFGDVVNWDLIPMNAIERFDLFPGSNPLFGLNTLGGAISVRSKSGFTAPGVEGSVQAGSFGRKQVQLSGGVHDDQFAGFMAFNGFKEDGWRDDSPSRVNQLFGRADWSGDRGSLTATVLGASNDLIGNGVIPLDLYKERAESVYTSPDQSKNKLLQFTLSGAFEVSPTMNVTGKVYRRKSDRRGVNGDVYEGFQDFSRLRDRQRDDPQPSTPGLPYCQVYDANEDGVYGRADGDVVLNGVVGQSCSEGTYGATRSRDGGAPGRGVADADDTTGVVEGTPIGLLSKTSLEQVSDGMAVQLNWNLERHKVMVGVSSDRQRAAYELRQRLGLMDERRQVYEDAANIDPIYRAAQEDIVGNKFDGTGRTNSLYASETWSPRDDLDLTFAGRYNHSRVKSRLFTRAAEGSADLHEIRNRNVVAPFVILCPTLDPASCPDAPEPYPFDFRGQGGNQTETRDTFTYTSFNPSVGFNWRPKTTLNVFGNLSRGARVPSVVELGCAFDGTLVPDPDFPDGPSFPRSLTGPTCSLPTTLSGDPYLPQIRSTSAEFGVRGVLASRWQWNASVFRTDLKDDLYFVGVGDGRSYFDTIGKTRRQGLELGVEGSVGAFDVKAAYSYVSATFESTFYTVSPYNSSADFDQNSRGSGNPDGFGQVPGAPTPGASQNRGFGTYEMIRIDPGARMPGIPAHSLNLNVGWRVTPHWKLGLGMIARSMSYMRGNENNRHEGSGTDQREGQYLCAEADCEASGVVQQPVPAGRAFRQKGTVPGYAIFNLDTTVTVRKGLRFFAQVSNLFDTTYYSAGRLGVNPFTPGQQGVNGPSGWNYNSTEWDLSSFVAPGAPRSFFVGLTWDLDPLE